MATAPAAHAAPAAEGVTLTNAAAKATSTLVANLAEQLGDRTAGSYLDASGRLVVNVTDAATASTVRAAGAVPRTVTRSAATLGAATDALDQSARIPGTSWFTDPVSNQVVVSYDSTVTGAALASLRATAAGLGDSVRLRSTPGTLRPLVTITGGDAIYTGGARCSLGFNVRRGSTIYIVTAGHCTNIGSNWTGAGGRAIGPRAGSSFPGNDYGLIQYTSGGWERVGGVNLYNGQIRDISNAGDPVVGQNVSRTGSTTGWRTGRVTGLNATVNYADGSVYGMIRTTVCAEPGDSGGPLFAGNTAYGITSGGSGNCSTGGETYFQPVTEALNRYGVSVY